MSIRAEISFVPEEVFVAIKKDREDIIAELESAMGPLTASYVVKLWISKLWSFDSTGRITIGSFTSTKFGELFDVLLKEHSANLFFDTSTTSWGVRFKDESTKPFNILRYLFNHVSPAFEAMGLATVDETVNHVAYEIDGDNMIRVLKNGVATIIKTDRVSGVTHVLTFIPKNYTIEDHNSVADAFGCKVELRDGEYILTEDGEALELHGDLPEWRLAEWHFFNSGGLPL